MTQSIGGRLGLSSAVAAAALAFALPATAAEPPPPGASSCSGCHASGSPIASLAGAPADKTASALAAFRSGERASTVMGRIAKGFSDAETKSIADWWSRQERAP